MFLHRLNDVEKKAFIELVHQISMANGILDQDELKMLEMYQQELGVQLSLDEMLDGRTLADLIPVFADSNSQRAVFIEAVAIAHIDGVYDKEEERIIASLREAFGLSEDYYMQVKEWVQAYQSICEKGMQLAN